MKLSEPRKPGAIGLEQLGQFGMKGTAYDARGVGKTLSVEPGSL
jgi:hypothetical protein